MSKRLIERNLEKDPITPTEIDFCIIKTKEELEDLNRELKFLRIITTEKLGLIVEEIKGLRSDLTGEKGIIQIMLKGSLKTRLMWMKLIFYILVILGGLVGIKIAGV